MNSMSTRIIIENVGNKAKMKQNNTFEEYQLKYHLNKNLDQDAKR